MKKNLLSIAVVVLFIFLAFGSDESSSSSSSSSSSENKYCSKHSRMYSPDNAYKGCPDCVKEKEQKKVMKNAPRRL